MLEEPDTELHAPALCDIEVCSALRRAVKTEKATVDRALLSLAMFLDLPITRHGHRPLLPRVFELRNNFTASDATYVALCEQLDATLVTCDARLTRGVKALLPLNVIGVG